MVRAGGEQLESRARLKSSTQAGHCDARVGGGAAWQVQGSLRAQASFTQGLAQQACTNRGPHLKNCGDSRRRSVAV